MISVQEDCGIDGLPTHHITGFTGVCSGFTGVCSAVRKQMKLQFVSNVTDRHRSLCAGGGGSDGADSAG